MEYIDPKQSVFEKKDGGLLKLKIGESEYYPIECLPMFPVSHPREYISVNAKGEDGPYEVGIIRTLLDLSKDQRALVAADLDYRYYIPEITDIAKIKSKFGVDEWVVTTDKGTRTFHVQDRKENVHIGDKGKVMITDMEKCRYQIHDFRRLPANAITQIESVLL